ncbi:hypothetical protein QR680_013328 [Steinernema hermaphroditum]|uniref:Uncharacterized protein n=1 Tax=Steinernema hermaphroditum TaxID=289476 RepID=A0AA39I7G2_9BILA|nr:hypothetical protein QR680_013328 [Steinernema hermaphroditum]
MCRERCEFFFLWGHLLPLIVLEGFRLFLIISHHREPLSAWEAVVEAAKYGVVTWTLLLSALVLFLRGAFAPSILMLFWNSAGSLYPLITYVIDHSCVRHLTNNVNFYVYLLVLDVIRLLNVPRLLGVSDLTLEHPPRVFEISEATPQNADSYIFALLFSILLAGVAHLLYCKPPEAGARGTSGLVAAFFGVFLANLPPLFGNFVAAAIAAHLIGNIGSDGEDSHEIHFVGFVAGYLLEGKTFVFQFEISLGFLLAFCLAKLNLNAE